MKLVWNNAGNELERLSLEATSKCRFVLAAVAYVSETRTLLQHCWDLKKPLTLFARCDYSGPVTETVLDWFDARSRKSANFEILVIPEFFHPKVIWWKGFGAYVGSANLSDRAWSGNIEAGIFVPERQSSHAFFSDLDAFFQRVKKDALPVTPSLRARMIKAAGEFDKADAAARRVNSGLLPKGRPVNSITKVPTYERKRTEFLNEWDEALNYLLHIGDRLEKGPQPSWIKEKPSMGVLTDQFLHAHYYQRVRPTGLKAYETFFEKNKHDRDRALDEALSWWQEQTSPPSNEDVHMFEWAPLVRNLLSEQKVRQLSRDEFSLLCEHIHAVLEHSKKMDFQKLTPGKQLADSSRKGRARAFGDWLFDQRSTSRMTPCEQIYEMLYGGLENHAPARMFDLCNSPETHINEIGYSTLGEIIGWAMPDIFPPRNGRTSKGLRSLGYDVHLHSAS